MRQNMKAFLLGMWEFRRSWTTRLVDLKTEVCYDWGREWAHRLTLRQFESK